MSKVFFYVVKYVKWIYSFYFYSGSLLLKVLKLFVKSDDKLILFISFGGRKFDDSPKAIYDKMIKDSRYDACRIVWAFVNPDVFEIPRGEKVKCDTFSYFVTALKARVWISNSTVERGLDFKGNNTFYFDTWHGTPIKKMGCDVGVDAKSFKGKGRWAVDYFTCQGEFDADVFGRVFYKIGRDKMHIIGLPRNDVYSNYTADYKIYLREKLGIPTNKRIILYAPTFREFNKGISMAVEVSVPINLEKWRNILAEDYVLLFRAHYEVAKGLDIKDDDFVREMSDYPLLEDLMIVSDILISDYSSIFFDYSIMGKPMISFCYDYDRYASERGMYFDIRDYLPYANNEDALLDLLKTGDNDNFVAKTKEFRSKFVTAYGNATDASLSVIADRMGLC